MYMGQGLTIKGCPMRRRNWVCQVVFSLWILLTGK